MTADFYFFQETEDAWSDSQEDERYDAGSSGPNLIIVNTTTLGILFGIALINRFTDFDHFFFQLMKKDLRHQTILRASLLMMILVTVVDHLVNEDLQLSQHLMLKVNIIENYALSLFSAVPFSYALI